MRRAAIIAHPAPHGARGSGRASNAVMPCLGPRMSEMWPRPGAGLLSPVPSTKREPLIVLSMVRTEEDGLFASKDTSGRSIEPRDRGASNGLLGTRGRIEGRSGEPGEQRSGSYHRMI